MFVHTLDDKNRLALPAKFRTRLADGVVITAGMDKCLLVYPAEEFQALFERVSALPLMDREAATLRRLLFTNAYDTVPDKQNRVVIPQALCDYAALAGEVIIVGVGRFIELWNASEWDRAQQEIRTHAADQNIWAKLGV
ncbi:MAG: division/cell wall cluster transcriptional repressor MraZ [Anaerolineae bacterium]|nr:division/cell wall cluster transcriptional repressor MraZ [Thermoflexales bacterium]MDW8395629.1 division/cell wall cluster transcriptional repressor MraZ [Anaerolineae bacterium]